jgi:hypothetical protein
LDGYAALTGVSAHDRPGWTGDEQPEVTVTTEPMEPDVPLPPRDRSAHGGASTHPNDDELALRAERERVAAGLQPYASQDVPPAADVTVPYDPEA